MIPIVLITKQTLFKMTKPEALKLLMKLEYKYISYGLLHTDMVTYKPENLSVLLEAQKEMPELRIYRDENKFRLIIEI